LLDCTGEELPVLLGRQTKGLILTACRSDEVRGAMWAEIDLQARLRTIPAARMKAGKEYRVPCPVLREPFWMPCRALVALFYLVASKGAELSDMSLTAALRRMGRGDITVHGFRLTLGGWHAESPDNSFPADNGWIHPCVDRVVTRCFTRSIGTGSRRGSRSSMNVSWASFISQES
jgi:integrase